MISLLHPAMTFVTFHTCLTSRILYGFELFIKTPEGAFFRLKIILYLPGMKNLKDFFLNLEYYEHKHSLIGHVAVYQGTIQFYTCTYRNFDLLLEDGSFLFQFLLVCGQKHKIIYSHI